MVELYALVQVASGLGGLLTLTLLVACTMAGFFVFRSAGAGFVAASAAAVGHHLGGAAPDHRKGSVADRALLLIAAALLIVPGFVTAALGVALLVPPIRALVRPLAVTRLVPRMTASSPFGASGATGFPGGIFFGDASGHFGGAGTTSSGFPGAGGPFGRRSTRDVVDVDLVDDVVNEDDQGDGRTRGPRSNPEIR